jgi:hypothetical protein
MIQNQPERKVQVLLLATKIRTTKAEKVKALEQDWLLRENNRMIQARAASGVKEGG